ncbi:hypothetical protein PF002_g9424 [Phytophthora fragariae]|uniref:Uncharacterized protein n=1 Tax=Phytophthora fragariae TaxID=53985 RepID=A0A6A3ZTI5_9STRA|nr:hypothetical protein PF003_g2284 [Phytophthora fragariae]KAE9099621.1 hypothetical protein PF007_g15804 [Phytophthora fragariae]KAE9144591.1 hypothetical protein PF006_g10486 [Phytophthora fragariae]KAE9222752.1 hypothetical protein PF004_g12717 [Phytophthora fragariae]KAE9241113.1 hypothetical protein PF002_g9424 [Phytophthora fragariae]
MRNLLLRVLVFGESAAMGRLLYRGIWYVRYSVQFVSQARSPGLPPVVINAQGLACTGPPPAVVNGQGPELLLLQLVLHQRPCLLLPLSSKYDHLRHRVVELQTLVLFQVFRQLRYQRQYQVRRQILHL